MKGKIIVRGELAVLTGLHIGGGTNLSAIGTTDSIVAKDAETNFPMIPGSSLKGKMKSLLKKFGKSEDSINRVFGSSRPPSPSLVQFTDCFVLKPVSPLTEVKYENTIGPNGIANPRQIERVVKGTRFEFLITYNIENEKDLYEDMKLLSTGFKYLQLDYLGGHGSRGYGRIRLENITCELPSIFDINVDLEKITQTFDDVRKYSLDYEV